jgi:uncharacterized membrane protein YjjB (DUF3815 family)
MKKHSIDICAITARLCCLLTVIGLVLTVLAVATLDLRVILTALAGTCGIGCLSYVALRLADMKPAEALRFNGVSHLMGFDFYGD